MNRNRGPGSRSAGQATFIEDTPPGYPRFAAWIGSHPSFQICRRFLRLRARLLLYKQDTLVALEYELDRIDREEIRPLFLGNRRRDKNGERKEIMKQIELELAEYDALVKRNCETLRLDGAQMRDISNIQNWLKDNGCIAREEAEYLQDERDLMSLGTFGMDIAVARMEGPVEDFLKWLVKKLARLDKLNIRLNISKDPKIFITQDVWLSWIARVLMSCVLGITLLVPVVMVESIRPLVYRFVATFFGITFFLLTLFGLTRAKTVEVFIAGATYAAVLTVFVNSSNSGGDGCRTS